MRTYTKCRFLILQINDIIIARKGGVVCDITCVFDAENSNLNTTIKENVKTFTILPAKLSLRNEVDLR